jgi:glycosyltransferase involved in cell wall biosynthesis
VTKDHVSVCVCTFRRPQLLQRLLESLAQQTVDSGITMELSVVDNDAEATAKMVVDDFSRRWPIRVIYDCEPERNISAARNRAVRNAAGDFVAFIDDDERAGPDWLDQLYGTLKRYQADGVLGPVIPELPEAAPAWLRKGQFLSRRRLATGTAIGAGDARTGNLLVRRAIFDDGDSWFDPAFGRTGGEDSDFFARQFCRGRAFVWCNEAIAFEAVPRERWKPSFHIRKLLRAGTLDGEAMRDGRMPSRGVVAKNILILCGCVSLAAPSFVLPKHVWMKILRKLAYSGGVVTAYYGYSFGRYRD